VRWKTEVRSWKLEVRSLTEGASSEVKGSFEFLEKDSKEPVPKDFGRSHAELKDPDGVTR
jgi:hypothetical protein